MSLVHGVDSSQILRPLLVDASGQPLVVASLAAGTALVGDVGARGLGYIGGAWQKQPLLGPYSAIQDEETSIVVAGVTQQVNSSIVPAGEYWRILAMTLYQVTNAPTACFVLISSGGVATYFAAEKSPVAGVRGGLIWFGEQVAGPGNVLQGIVTGCTVGDSIHLRYHAVRVDVDL